MKDKAQLLKDTREAAIAFLEDYEHMVSIISRDVQKKSDLRRASAIVRRCLIQGDLVRIAAPRIGRIHLEAPDNKPFYVSSRKMPFPIFVSAGVTLFGVTLRAFIIENLPRPRKLPENFNPGKRILFSINSFQKQNVICWQGDWINRREIIKFVSNVGSGVHSGTPKSEADKKLAIVRHIFSVSLIDPATQPDCPETMPADIGLIPSINFNANAVSTEDLPVEYDSTTIDCVLLELLAIMSFLVNSQDVKRLCEVIRNEL